MCRHFQDFSYMFFDFAVSDPCRLLRLCVEGNPDSHWHRGVAPRPRSRLQEVGLGVEEVAPAVELLENMGTRRSPSHISQLHCYHLVRDEV